jgi:CubicO group peptidase (beta-lactamase class C family)
MRLRLMALPAIAAFALTIAMAADARSPNINPLTKGKPDEVGMSAPRLAKITQALEKEIADKKLPGAVVMVARRGKIVYQNTFGVLSPERSDKPMPADAIFRIYSMTKPIMSVGLMTLVEDGRVQLTDPVSKFLPAFKDTKVVTASGEVAQDRQMTIQDILRHTAGLAYGEITKNEKVKEGLIQAGILKKEKEFDSRDMSGPEQVARLAKVPLIHQPGTTWEYSLAVDVQGRVIEAVTGKRAGEYLEERIFRPLKMVDTGFWVPEAKIDRLAGGFAKDPASGNTYPLIDVSKQPGNDSGGAGGVSTANDYLRFTQMLLNGGTLEGARILAPSTIKLMTSDHLAGVASNPQMPGELLLGTKGYTFGLGFAVRMADGIAGVPGSAGDFMWAGYAGTYFWVDPAEEIVAVYMTQAPSPVRASYRKLIKQLVYQAIIQ